MALLSGRDTHSRGADRDCTLPTFIGTTGNGSKDQTEGVQVCIQKTELNCPWMHHGKAMTGLPLMQQLQLVQGKENDGFLYFQKRGKHLPNWKYNPTNNMLYAQIRKKGGQPYWERYHPLEFDMFVMRGTRCN